MKTKFATNGLPVACALVLCLANAFKAAVIDDLGYVWYARQIVKSPAQPFGPPPDGFSLIWYDRGQGAFTLLTPMVVPYWLALGMTIFGEHLVLLKLWLFPFCLLFTAGLFALLRQHARPMAKPLLILTTFSPLILPSLNLMVDLPALGLSLVALAAMHRGLASTSSQNRWAIVAGLLAGLASQTKYTGLTTVALLVLHAMLQRRWRMAILAGFVSLTVFIGWEAYLVHVYGRSHFLVQYEQRRIRGMEEATNASLPTRIGSELLATLEKKSMFAGPLLPLLGSSMPTLLLMLACAFRCSRRILWVLMSLSTVFYLLLALLPERWSNVPVQPHGPGRARSWFEVLAGIQGGLTLFYLVGAALYLGMRGWSRRRPRIRGDRGTGCLIVWLIVEILAFFVLSPFVASRRIMGISMAGTILGGKLLGLTARDVARQRLITPVVLFGIVLGILYAGTDFHDAQVEQRAVKDCWALLAPESGTKPTIWFCGHWGFQYYAEAAGGLAVYPSESVLQEGDWLLYPETLLRPYGQLIVLEPEWAERWAILEWHDAWPWRTIPDFYQGGLAINHHEGPRMRVTIFRIKKAFLAQPT